MTDTLREKALKATKGPWVYPRDDSKAPDLAIFSAEKPKAAMSEHGPVVAHVVMYDAITGLLPKGQFEANADFIAAANPSTILSLLDEIDRLRETRQPTDDEAEAAFQSWWRASKYCQVIFPSKYDEQLARDAYRAASQALRSPSP